MRVLGRRTSQRAVNEQAPSDFIPPAEPARYKTPKASIDPDPDKAWWKRALPLVKAHRWTFITALALSMAALVIQVQIPNIVRQAIDGSLVSHSAALSGFVWSIVALAFIRCVLLYVSRRFLLQTGYAIESDLRNAFETYRSVPQERKLPSAP